MLYKAAIIEEKDSRGTDELMNYVRIQEIFLDLLHVSETIKSLPMPGLDEPAPLQDDPIPLTQRREQLAGADREALHEEEEIGGPAREPDSMRDGPDPTGEELR